MPIYEFRCEACGERFERLVAAGTATAPCESCDGAARRLLSAPAPPLHLVRTPAERRKQERKNAQLRDRTKSTFKAQRERAREGRKKAPGT